MIIMKYLKIIISCIAVSVVFNACKKDFLDRSPLDEVTSLDYFKNPEELKTYVNQYYNNTFFSAVWQSRK